LAAELRTTFPGVDVHLEPSGGGRFEVSRDGQPIFEKSKLGRHAKPGEIVKLLSAAGDPSGR
jgi:selT/selW/selH-like putative selenoprotein